MQRAPLLRFVDPEILHVLGNTNTVAFRSRFTTTHRLQQTIPPLAQRCVPLRNVEAIDRTRTRIARRTIAGAAPVSPAMPADPRRRNREGAAERIGTDDPPSAHRPHLTAIDASAALALRRQRRPTTDRKRATATRKDQKVRCLARSRFTSNTAARNEIRNTASPYASKRSHDNQPKNKRYTQECLVARCATLVDLLRNRHDPRLSEGRSGCISCRLAAFQRLPQDRTSSSLQRR